MDLLSVAPMIHSRNSGVGARLS